MVMSSAEYGQNIELSLHHHSASNYTQKQRRELANSSCQPIFKTNVLLPNYSHKLLTRITPNNTTAIHYLSIYWPRNVCSKNICDH